MAADEKYPVLNTGNLTIAIQMQLSPNQKKNFFFFCCFFEVQLKFWTFWNKRWPHSFCIFEVTDSEIVVRQMFIKSCFRGCYDKQYGRRAQTLLKSAPHQLYHIHWSWARKLCSKKSLLLTWKLLGLLVNTLATVENCPVLYREYLTLPIQMQLSQIGKIFSQFFAAFLKSRLNFECFEKKKDPSSFGISKTTDSEHVVR